MSVQGGRRIEEDPLLVHFSGELDAGDPDFASELLTKAGHDASCVIVDGVVTISIQDGQPELRRPVIADSDFLAENGRGLHIVAAIAHDWGITTAANGKVVWFNLSIPETSGDDADVLSLDRERQWGSRARAAADELKYESHDDDLHGVEEHVEARRRENVESAG